MTEPTLDPAVLQQWIGKTEQRTDTIAAQPAQFMQATMDQQPTLKNGEVLPHGWHWLYFLEARPMSELGRDGHPVRGGLLPPVALPRRMWAGTRLNFYHPLNIGDTIRKITSIKDVLVKSGKSGQLCFVTVLHEFWRDNNHVMSEEHDIVYREDPKPGALPPAPPKAEQNAERVRIITPTAVLLYRYSALTFNGHRIHYDIDYCRDVEGYPGLVFHGPLSATLMLDLLSHSAPANSIRNFNFRAISPLYADRAFTLNLSKNSDGYKIWATNPDGLLAIEASAA